MESFSLSKEAVFFVDRSINNQRKNRVRDISFLIALPLFATPWVSYQIISKVEIREAWETIHVIEGKEYNPIRNQALERLSQLGAQLSLASEIGRLEGVYFGNISLNGSKLQSANLVNANLKSANLRKANLTEADLSGVNLINANLKSASLINTNLSDANLSGVNFIGVKLSNADLTSASLNLANLTSANLSDADLINANLSNANLTNANLSDADLINANLSNTNLTNANLSNAKLSDVINLTSKQIKSACNWENALYKGNYEEIQDLQVDGLYDWKLDEVANQKYIEKLKADKASEPEKPVDCSRWE